MQKYRANFSKGRDVKLLIASAIKQKPQILEEFLFFISRVNKENLDVDYYFVDDNDDIKSKKLLKSFYKQNRSNVILKQGRSSDTYICDDYTHRWNDRLIWKVAGYKNEMIEYAKANGYEYIFFIDSDLLIHPDTIQQLIASKKDIISEIFWTKWTPESIELPQVWQTDQYDFFSSEFKKADEQTKQLESLRFIKKLKKPGIYKVGGLGACTLISSNALQKGVSFERIYNLSLWGEDRHFCVRAAALGFELFVDTHYPALHLYRLEDLQRVDAYKEECFAKGVV